MAHSYSTLIKECLTRSRYKRQDGWPLACARGTFQAMFACFLTSSSTLARLFTRNRTGYQGKIEAPLFETRHIADLSGKLVAIDSVNLSLGPEEKDNSTLCSCLLENLGLEVHLDERMVPGRSNALAIRQGSGSGRSFPSFSSQ